VIEVGFVVVAVPTGEQPAFATTKIAQRAAIRTTAVEAADIDSGAHSEFLEGYARVP
jgi:hypothetical protein